MKSNKFITLLVPLVLLLASCKRQYDCVEPSKPVSKGFLIRIQQGTQHATDTVKLITYDPSDRIRTVADSLSKDSMYAFYDASGRISRIVQIRHSFSQGNISTSTDSVRFVYDQNGLLSEAAYSSAGTKNILTYEYNNNIVVRKTYYTDAGVTGGTLVFLRYFTFEVTGGNITRIKEYDALNNLRDEKKLTYSSQPNPFKNISLFNFANKLGTDDIINYETYFCNNVITGYTNNLSSVSMENSFNDVQKPVKIISRFDVFSGKDFDYVFTRFFTYN